MLKKIKVLQYGCGPIGCSIVRLALQRAPIEIVGAVDLLNVGKDLGELAETKNKLGILISNDAESVFKRTKPDIVLHATGSSLEAVYPQLKSIIKSGISIVSTCEELAFPYRKQPKLSATLDELAKKHKVAVLATGVNPGFLMDTWPLFMTAVCQDVKKIKAIRIQDASSRRIPFQKKIGAGKTESEFDELVSSGNIRHVGLPESIAMIASGLGWKLDYIEETIDPIILQHEVKSDFVTVKRGQAAGVKQVGTGIKDGEDIIILDFQAYIGAPESYDAVYITGTPNMEVIIKGGTQGDLATAAAVVNSIPNVLGASPGLKTMKDIPIVCSWT